MAVGGGNGVDDVVVAPGHPEHLPVGRQVAHIRATPAGDPPSGDDLPGCEADQSDRAVAPVGHVQVAGVAARVQAVRVRAGGDEPGHFERRSVNQPHPGVVLVGDVEDAPGGVQLDVLRCGARQGQVTGHGQRVQVDPDQAAGVLAGGDQVGAGGREVDVVYARAVDVDPVFEGEGVRVAEVQVLAGFGHHDGVASVGGEVHVVRVVYGDVAAGWRYGLGIDRGQEVGQVVRHVQRAHVVGGHHVLRVEPGLVSPDYPVGGGIDDGHGGSTAVRHVDAVRHPAYGWAEHVRPGVGVDVGRVSDRGHPRQRRRQVSNRALDLPRRGRR